MYAQEEEDKSYELVQFNHEDDTDDIPDGMDPVLIQTQFSGRPIGELLLQIQFNHEDDTDDIPDGQDPVLLQQ